ncbi:NADP oxidoreductase coenzyme F420-dependent [Bifidobacterium actinocoloniiforme DSM 22766]|uniref:NADP oxidoreductase coenzyme F420-dependent n=1 Tax=Bifidobacterium actinocoloniiforme DSM 22766 TaxID=1437605 RepID=A0A086YVU5_9BIFI|nr:NAD(P)-binding domain-containing protein [Bifidobacterium actinocoloniiforme]AKV54949.1 hypothetical protein AB656_00130 [Bifidobacterium actinocoloniiforme DSM 22766]KFI38395.1 NADP oxidoreductase coenzyme F420-dependent [Bifidobacterium actinocoloniiforme DSM 22766]
MSNMVILGSGNVGTAIGKGLRDAGHAVASVNTSTSVEDVVQAIRQADFVFLAVPLAAALSLQQAWVDALDGKTVVDMTNPLTPDFANLTVGFGDSAGEQVARALPKAKVVKALNAVLAPNHDLTAFGKDQMFVPVAGEEASAGTVVDLLRSVGFDAQYVGDITCSRYIEPVAEVLIRLAYMQGQGTGIALKLMRA